MMISLNSNFLLRFDGKNRLCDCEILLAHAVAIHSVYDCFFPSNQRAVHTTFLVKFAYYS